MCLCIKGATCCFSTCCVIITIIVIYDHFFFFSAIIFERPVTKEIREKVGETLLV